MWRRLAFFLSLCLPVAACSNTYVLSDSAQEITLAPSIPGTVVELNACGACVFGEPDQVFAVPPNFAQINFYPDGNPERVVVTGNAFDTPSSSGYGQTVPTTQEDCQRYYRATRMWEKKEGTDTWVQVGKQINTGSWSGGSGGSCSIGGALTYSPLPSTTNQARRLRVAVKVLERETAQKAAVEISQPPPK